MRVILLARAYNDLDCRLPLLHQFMGRPGVTVSILIIPTVSSSGLSVKHPLPERMGVPCEAAVIKLMSSSFGKLVTWASRLLEQSANPLLRSKVWRKVWARIYRYLSKSQQFRDDFLALTGHTVTIIDDILATPARSFIVPLVVSNQSVRLLCLSHGQNTYLNLWYDKPKKSALTHPRPYPLEIYAPSENDRRILAAQYPGAKVTTIGNTRFDSRWVLEYQERFIGKAEALPVFCGTKIAFMMSKMEYGLEADNVIRLINQAATRSNTRIVLKPHTRGMSLEGCAWQLDDKIVVADTVSSSEIINWADIIFFTGSSIIFEAIVKEKKVLYLAALQRYQTVFDQLPSVSLFREGDDLNAAIDILEREPYDWQVMRRFLASNTHNGVRDGQVCAAFVDRIISELEH